MRVIRSAWLLLGLACCGCASLAHSITDANWQIGSSSSSEIASQMSRWIGGPLSALVAGGWGYPTSTFNPPGGTEIVYTWVQKPENQTYPQEKPCNFNFVTNAQGIIQSYSYTGWCQVKNGVVRGK